VCLVLECHLDCLECKEEGEPMNPTNLSGVTWGLTNEALWQPPTDVYETDDSAVVIVEIAGLSEGSYEVGLMGRSLVITGERHDPAEKLAYQQMEIRYGRFRTQVHLPWPLDSTDHTATYEDGFLKIVLRKARARRVPVRIADDMQS
jgi:HSP20 family protein